MCHNEYNPASSRFCTGEWRRGGAALPMTEQYRESAGGRPIPALKSFVVSPFVKGSAMDRHIAWVEEARREVAG